ncbi:hypothetical protein ARMSODRAFT_1091221 [Armillaria solidipes]|uniref:Uncharacterized protein n=1 Tax=Armillaria solidipes TaxID=1076256 RepID=A0A2H3AKY2_9AGAR|nr:hypothetical protein ARMSODRAFT_1091221 [Armillaria solidipes]
MSTQADIPSGLPDDYKALVFQYLDAQLNSRILFALLLVHRKYTGILAVTLWNIFINKCWPIRRAMVVIIVLLHALITISFAVNWSYICTAFIDNEKSFWTVYLTPSGVAASFETGIAASMSTILADLFMIWWCWMVWGRRWLVVLLPILSLVSATASRIIQVYLDHFNATSTVFITLYTSFTLATTLWCTLLIIYRILTVAGVKRGADGRLRVYQQFIEVLVESSALYSISLIGVAPTLIVGRITAGHRARPDDSWQGSVIGSASIRSRSQERSQTSFREDDWTSPMRDGDLEAQRESSVREPSPTLRSVSVLADYAHAKTDVSPRTSPHLRNRSLLYHGSSLYGDANHDSTVVDEVTALRR